ncbi:thiol-activated cytolysin family protein [Pedobacter foliorum]|uniref:thiol-activated cytolysin family protein n=1 Tax=Pedobacter foliorum TaxID=2739058 RepID=UPI001565E0BE|nr:thiol-activated cytolysin family protein [Pedobacter foliorum]NRF40092.1 thiol-activated cytolysin family protein [Pedobacter foliorum]
MRKITNILLLATLVMVSVHVNAQINRLGGSRVIGVAAGNQNDIANLIKQKSRLLNYGNVHSESSVMRPTAGSGGYFLRYERGWVYYNPLLKQAFGVTGDIMTKWGATGYETGELGFPASDETIADKSSFKRMAKFDKGTIYWNDGRTEVVKTSRFAAAAPVKVSISAFTPATSIRNIGGLQMSIVKRTDKDISSSPKFSTPKKVRETVEKSENDSVLCKTEYRSYSVENMNQEILNPEAMANLWLGGVYDLNELAKGNFNAINHNRTAVVFTMSNKDNLIEIPVPDKFNLKSKVEEFRKQPFASSPLGFGQYLESSMINSEAALNIAAGASYTGYGVSLKDKFNYNTSTKKRKFLLNYVNPMYTISAGSKTDSLFNTGDANNINGNLVYIDHITYGVKLMVYFEAELEESEIENNFKGDGWGAHLTIDAKVAKKMENTIFKIFLYGSRQPISTNAKGYTAMLRKTDDLLKAIVAGNKKNPQELGEPISYSLRFLDGKIAATSCKVENIPEQNCRVNNDRPMNLNIALMKIKNSNRDMWGWVDAELLDKEGISIANQTIFDFGKSAAVSSNEVSTSPIYQNVFRNIGAADRAAGKVRLWFWINSSKGNYSPLQGYSQQSYTTRPGHSGKHYYVDIPMGDVLMAKVGQPLTKDYTAQENSGDRSTYKLTFKLVFE